VVAVDASGHIRAVCPAESLQGLALLSALDSIVHVLAPTQYLVPVFIDTHIHAAQFLFNDTPYSHHRTTPHNTHKHTHTHKYLCVSLSYSTILVFYLGTATDRPLLQWLNKYTLPAERSLGIDPAKAERVCAAVVDRTLRNGTMCAVYHATADLAPCEALVRHCLDRGGGRGLSWAR